MVADFGGVEELRAGDISNQGCDVSRMESGTDDWDFFRFWEDIVVNAAGRIKFIEYGRLSLFV